MAFACALVAVTAGLVGGVNYMRVVEIARDLDVAKLDSEARLIAPRFEAAFTQLQSDAIAVSRMPPFQGILRSTGNGGIDPLDGSTTEQWRARLLTIFRSLMEHRPGYVQMRYIGISDDGLELVRTDRKNGVLIDVPTEALQEKKQESYFQEALKLKEGEVHFTKMSLNRDHGKVDIDLPVLRIVAPVWNRAGKIFGMVVINANAEQLLQTVLSEVEASGDIYVVTDSGDWMIRTQGGTVSELHLHGTAPENTPAMVREIEHSLSTERFREVDVDGEVYFLALGDAAFTRSATDRFLRIGLAISRDAALSVAHETRRQTTWLTLLVIAVVSLLAYLVSRYVSKPFQNVVQAIQSYEIGKSGLDLPFHRSDEIGDLSRAFGDLVTDLEKSRIAERRTLERLRAILDNTADGIITIDREGCNETFNAAAESMFQYSGQEVIGKNVSVLMPAAYREQHDINIRNFRTAGESTVVDKIRVFEGRRKDGSHFPMELAASVVEFGTELVFSGIVRDISERRALEQKIDAYTEKLEISNRDLDDFANIASHDLREPLRAIHNHVEFLEEDHGDALGKDGKDRIERIQKVCQRAELLTTELLNFSRIGRNDLALEDVDLNVVVDGIREDLLVTLDEKNASIIVPEPLPVMMCDRVRITSVFQNLIANAVKYSTADEKTVTLGMLPEVQCEGKTMRNVFFARDNGIGIDAKFESSVFKMFKRLNAEKEYGPGTGAGLAFVKKIVERHNGQIWLESVPGEGTTFYFTLEDKAAAQ